MKYLKKLSGLLLAPFEGALPVYAFVVYCTSCVYICHFLSRGWPVVSLLQLLFAAIISYPIILLYAALKGKFRKVVLVVLILFSVINLLVDATVIATTDSPFNFDHAGLILGTNISEGQDFVRSYVDAKLVCSSLSYLALGVFVWIMADKIKGFGRNHVLSVSGVVLLCAGTFISDPFHSGYIQSLSVNKLSFFFKYQSPPDLSLYRTTPTLTMSDEWGGINRIVVIIGESFSREFSSLYGYDRVTNPSLASLEKDGELFTFETVCSPANHTIPSFKQMMSSYGGDDNLFRWEECLTIFDVARAADYHCTWVSNQSRKGVYDNVVTRYAELSDTTLWVGSAYGLFYEGYDELVLPVVDSISSVCHRGKELLFVHLMGSHEDFESRYPQQWGCFSESDYSAFPEHQRRKRMAYDNSILYNDNVVFSLMRMFSDDDAVCLYLSDHGLDVYETDPYFCGHSRETEESRKAGVKIPFLVYIPSRVQTYYPCLVECVKSALDVEYNTKNLMYTIARLMGVCTIDGAEILEKSLF